MNRDTWARLEEICTRAAGLPAEARDTFLDESCEGDAELRAEAASLLARLVEETPFLDEPIARVTDGGLAEPLAAATQVGSYRIVRPLGTGGMGEVFLALQEGDGFERHVALKLVRRGMDSAAVLDRFRVERAILAGLDHPGIARLYDAGVSEDGRPFLVMEFVDGLRIDTWCDREDASIETRLRLLQEMCAAVQHAHQNLILHRDLKPSNVLVTDDGQVKLLDFGVGKILDSAGADEPADRTRTEMRMLTPEYASPEQLDGRPVTTATDIYSLGVIAYELLSGHHPFQGTGRTRPELERLIRDGRPMRPSERVLTGEAEPAAPSPEVRKPAGSRRLGRRLAGDLDNIVLKAIRKEPERRYTSANALAEDIGRHVAGRPVRARPDTFGYRAGKFARRNAAAVVAASVAATALVSAAAWTALQNRRVVAESARVVAERDKALAVQGFLMETFGAVGRAPDTGDEVAARALLDAQARSLSAYEDRPELLAEMRHVLADGYERLGSFDEAEPLAREALAWRASTLGAGDLDAARTRSLLGWIVRQRGDPEAAEPLLQESLAYLEVMGPRGEPALARTLSDLGVVYGDLARTEDAEAALRRSLELRDGLSARDDRAYGITANNLAANLAQQGRMAEAAEYMDAAASALEAGLGPDHARVWSAKSNRAVLRMYEGYTPELILELRDVLASARRIFGGEHPNTSRGMAQLAIALRDTPYTAGDDRAGRLAESEALLREALAYRESQLGPTHPDLIETVSQLGATLRAAGQSEQAIPLLRRGVQLSETNFGDRHPRTGIAWSRLGDALDAADRSGESTSALVTSLEILRESLGDAHRETATQMLKVGRRYMEIDRHSDGLELISLGEEATRGVVPEGHRSRLMARLWLAEAQLFTGDTVRADSVLTEAEAEWAMDDTRESERLRRFLAIVRDR